MAKEIMARRQAEEEERQMLKKEAEAERLKKEAEIGIYDQNLCKKFYVFFRFC